MNIKSLEEAVDILINDNDADFMAVCKACYDLGWYDRGRGINCEY